MDVRYCTVAVSLLLFRATHNVFMLPHKPYTSTFGQIIDVLRNVYAALQVVYLLYVTPDYFNLFII